MRDVYIKPSKEFHLERGQLLQLLKHLYDLSDSGDYWHVTFSKHLRDDLMMTPTTGDLSLFSRSCMENGGD